MRCSAIHVLPPPGSPVSRMDARRRGGRRHRCGKRRHGRVERAVEDRIQVDELPVALVVVVGVRVSEVRQLLEGALGELRNQAWNSGESNGSSMGSSTLAASAAAAAEWSPSNRVDAR